MIIFSKIINIMNLMINLIKTNKYKNYKSKIDKKKQDIYFIIKIM